ncbi:hypothetical protein DC60_11035 [Streptomyces wadayamensis]|uniref:Uncharacterized protein n=1 Tax=Streptomyces wadayamensis TaxID=141454 RepID=A0ABR4SF04_9ACTN|nr:hypothetical protein DC60_11035 [Streptomyces wadayamensis]
MPTLTTTPEALRSRSGRKACRTRTTPTTLVSSTVVTSAAVKAPAGLGRPLMPALLTRTSSPPCSSTRAAAAATDASSVTSRTSGRAPSSRAARPAFSGVRAAAYTVCPAAVRRRAVSKPRPLLAPVIRVVVMAASLRRSVGGGQRGLFLVPAVPGSFPERAATMEEWMPPVSWPPCCGPGASGWRRPRRG